MALLDALGDEAGVCESLTTQAHAYTELGLPDEALASLGTCLDIAQRLDNDSLLCWTSNRIGNVHSDLHDHAQAKQFLRHARELARTADLGAERSSAP